jgi:hypothetical protein
MHTTTSNRRRSMSSNITNHLRRASAPPLPVATADAARYIPMPHNRFLKQL